MRLFGHLTKAVRWAASSVAGKKGRDIVDQYAPAFESCVAYLVPTLNMDDREFAHAAIEGWAQDRGVALEDIGAFVDAVREKAGKP